MFPSTPLRERFVYGRFCSGKVLLKEINYWYCDRTFGAIASKTQTMH
ncbi:MAG: hypothetical protein KME50_27295 [Nostoc desertorum CM1-VF14]|nr:hypothetical protein [Nostoc desertorum CM1-VF14]